MKKKTDNDWFVCRDRLASLELGTVIEFEDKVTGLVIRGFRISPDCVIGGKAVLLITTGTTKPFWGQIAGGYSYNKCRVVGRWKAGVKK